MISLEEISKKLFNEKEVALFCHIRPDGDTVGSALALRNALLSKGIKADVYCEDSISSSFSYLKNVQDVKKEMKDEYSALVAIDCADISRLGKFGAEFVKHKNTYSIDHHISNTGFAKYSYLLDNASNCENVYDIIKTQDIEIDYDTANLLATGIITDTGNFKHKNVTANTLKVAGELFNCGADFNKIIYCNFTMQSKERALLFGITMQKIRYFLDGKLAVASVRLTDIEKSGAKQDETEGFIDFVMGIIGVEVGICLLETEKDKYKVSFRSKTADVNAVASTFGGGGHTLASGCRINGEYEEVVDKLRFAVSRYLPE